MHGPLILEFVQENSRKYELRLREVETRISQANTDELRIEQELAQNLASLADLQIESHPDIGETAIRQLELRADEEKALRTQLASVEQDIAVLMQQSHTNLAEIYRAEHKEKDYLAADRMYQSVREEHAAVLMNHRATEANYQDVDEEVKRKLPQFEQNPVYCHLRECQFGTDAYGGKGFSRVMDNWLARLCNFRQNRQNEVTLHAMQREIEEGAATRKKRLESLKATMEPMLKAAAHQVGLPSLHAMQQSIKRDIEIAKGRANAVNDRLAEYTEKRDIRYVRTREALTAFLSKQSAESLLGRVRRTNTQEDDVVANRVVNLQFELKTVQESLTFLQTERGQAHKEYERAKTLEHRMKHSEFSSPQHDYPTGPDMQSLVQGFMSERLSMNAVADMLRSHRTRYVDA